MVWKYLSTLVLVSLVVAILAPIFPVVIAQDQQEDQQEDVVIDENCTMRAKPVLLSAEDAIKLAYIVRNITYALFQWEIGYNITAANVTLVKADRFLARAEELLAQNYTHRARAFAIVAVVHYSHAPALANPVLGKQVLDELYEANGTITADAVNKVLSLRDELNQIYLGAKDYAASNGFNTTWSDAYYAKSQEAYANATQFLSNDDNVTAFAYAVKSYRLLVRAYAVLVKEVIAQYLKTQWRGLTREMAEWRIRVVEKIADKVPAEVRERLMAKIKNGEVKTIREAVDEVRKEIQPIREEKEIREVARILTTATIRFSNHSRLVQLVAGRAIYNYMYDLVKDVANKTGKHGLDLLLESINELQNRLQQGIDIREEINGKIMRGR